MLPWHYNLDNYNSRWIQTWSTDLIKNVHLSKLSLLTVIKCETESAQNLTTLTKAKLECLIWANEDYTWWTQMRTISWIKSFIEMMDQMEYCQLTRKWNLKCLWYLEEILSEMLRYELGLNLLKPIKNIVLWPQFHLIPLLHHPC